MIAALAACAGIRTVCPAGTAGRRRIFSGGAEAEWCHRADGVHHGPEVRYYENGSKMIEGTYLDGVRHGEWGYWMAEGGRPWRRDRWEDGALVGKKIELPAGVSSGVDVLGPTSSNIIKTASADPLLDRTVRANELPIFAVWYDDGKPRVLGHYDRDGLRTKTWLFWHQGGRPAREVAFESGMRQGVFREWHANGRAKTDGAYAEGERDGRWRRWDEDGRVVADQVYARVMVSP
jgi:uncharacterized protein